MSRHAALTCASFALSLAACAPDASTMSEEKKILDLDAAIRHHEAGKAPPRMTVSLRPTSDGDAPDSEATRRWLASARRGRPAVLVAADPLPEGAIAKVVRDPAAEHPRLLVVSRAGLDDEVLALAQFILMQSEMNTPELATRREITIWRDRRYRVEEGGTTRDGAFDYTWLVPGKDDEARAVTALASRAGRPAIIGHTRGMLVERDAR